MKDAVFTEACSYHLIRTERSKVMKTDYNKTLITSAGIVTVLLLAFQPTSAFNRQPEPPAGEDTLAVPSSNPYNDSKTDGTPSTRTPDIAIKSDGMKTTY